MDLLTPTFWIISALLCVALISGYVFPPLAVLLGLAAGGLMLWMMMGGGR
jgi:hypothetical protein